MRSNSSISISIGIFLIALFQAFGVSAQKPVIVPKTKMIWKWNLKTNDSVVTMADRLHSNFPTTLQWDNSDGCTQNIVSSKALVSLEVIHEEVDGASTAYDYTFTVQVKHYNAALSLSTDIITLNVQNIPTSGKSYKDKDVVILHDVVYTDIKVLAINDNLTSSIITDPANNLKLQSQIQTERYFDFDYSSTCTFSGWSNTIKYLPNYNGFSFIRGGCDNICGETEWELEWMHVDNYRMQKTSGAWSQSGEIADTDLEFDFDKGATRIRLSAGQDSVFISNVFEEGYLLLRLRPLGRTGAAFDKYVYGEWIPYQTGLVNTYGAKFKYKITSALAHEADELTWQYVSTFAEDGKNKEVVSYHDGLNKNRQAVTRLSTEKAIVVGETVYDYEGRPAVQILPVPADTTEKGIQYIEKFNRDVSGNSYGPDDFDDLSDPGLMDTLHGASQYYSTNNDHDESINRDMIPHAQGYPFAQTVYMNDQTGRIKYQSGVGADHRIGQHMTRYEYSKPGQSMLNKLFGSEVGYGVHYKENIVIDPNGQISVSYVDQHGRVIATSLAGANPDNLSKLTSAPDTSNPSYIQVDLGGLNNARIPEARPTSYELSYPFFAKSNDSVSFWYELQPEQYSLSCNNICLECLYKLEITVIRDDGAVFYSTNKNIGPIGNQALTCSSPDTLRLWEGDSLENSSFKLYMPIGKYTIVKKLKLRTDLTDNYWEDYLASGNSCLLPMDVFIQSALDSLPSCDSLDDFFLADSIPTPCKGLYKGLLADVSPGGQYGLLVDSLGAPLENHIDSSLSVVYEQHPSAVSVFNSSNILISNWSYDIFHVSNWRFPYTSYLNWSGEIDSIFDTLQGTWVNPENVTTLAQYLNNWNSTWAHSLVYYHPEYAYYDACVNEFWGSNWFDDSLRQTTSYAAALSKGYITNNDTTDTTIYFRDPYSQLESSDFTPALTNPGFLVSNQNGLLSLIDDAYTASGKTLDLKNFAAMVACTRLQQDTNNCWLARNFGATGLSTEHLDLQWQVYKSYYLSHRQKQIDKFLYNQVVDSRSYNYTKIIRYKNTDLDLVGSNFLRPTVPTSHWAYIFEGISNQYVFAKDLMGFDPFSNVSIQTNMETFSNQAETADCTTRCSSYIDLWKEQLSSCPIDAGTLDSVINGLLEVCQAGCNVDRMFSADSLSHPTASGYTSFRDVLVTILGSEKAYGNYCNRHLLNMPYDTAHHYFNGGDVTLVDDDCGCNALEIAAERVKSIRVDGSDCTEWISSSVSGGITEFLNELKDDGKLVDNPQTYTSLIGTSYTNFTTYIRPQLTSIGNDTFEATVQVTESNLGIRIRERGVAEPLNFCNITLYYWTDSFSSFPSSPVFINIRKADVPPPSGTPGKGLLGFLVDVINGSDTVSIYGYSPCLRSTATTESYCAKWTATTREIKERVYAVLQDGYLSKSQFEGLLHHCKNKGYDFDVFNYASDAECYPYQTTPDKAKGIFHWVQQMASHDSTIGQKKFMLGVDEYDYGSVCHATVKNGRYDFLPDNFGAYEFYLLPFFNVYNNFAYSSENLYNRDHWLWGGWIGFGCSDLDTVDQCYVSLSAVDNSTKTALQGVGGIGLQGLDSIDGYKYNYYYKAFTVEAWHNGTSYSLILDNCAQNICDEPTDTCGEPEYYQVVKNEKKHNVGCSNCYTYAMEDFLNDLAVNSKLTSTTEVDISSYNGYSSSYPYSMYRSGTDHRYKVGVDPDVLPVSQTLYASFGSTNNKVSIWLKRPNNGHLFSEITSITDLKIDTVKLGEQLEKETSLYSATFYFQAWAWYDSSGVAKRFLITGYNNTFSLGECFDFSYDQSLVNLPEEWAAKCPRCVECKDLTVAIDSFRLRYPEMAVGHGHFNRMFYRFMNEWFNNNMTEAEWLEFVENCDAWELNEGRRLSCGYTFKVPTDSVNSGVTAVDTLQEWLRDSIGQTYTYTRTVSGTANVYCFDLQHLSDSNRLLALKNLRGLVTSLAATDNDSDVLSTDTLSIRFINDTLTADCRGGLRTLLSSSSLATQYSLVFDSTATSRYSAGNSKAAVSYMTYSIQVSGLSLSVRSLIQEKIDSLLDGCPYSWNEGLWYRQRGNTKHSRDTICTSANVLVSGLDTTVTNPVCTDCETIRNQVLNFHRNHNIASKTYYEAELKSYLRTKLHQRFAVYRKESDCNSCGGMATWVCDDLSPGAEALEEFLNHSASRQKLIGSHAINNDNIYYIGTPLYDDENIGHQLTYGGSLSGNDTLIVQIKDTNYYYNYLGLYADDPDHFNFNQISRFTDLALHASERGDNHWFTINAYDSIQESYFGVTGYVSRTTLSNCCMINDLQACFKPLFRDVGEETDCDSVRIMQANIIGAVSYYQYLEEQKDSFKERYRHQCALAFNDEKFQMLAPQMQHHWTLYYYDQAGNLVRTVPPKGVNLLDDADTATVNNWRKLNAQDSTKRVYTEHELSTYYNYNTLNQVKWQKTPDGGISKFYYDRLGRLVFSQNAEQRADGHIYSYTKYDAIGRIVEVGEISLASAVSTNSLLTDTSYYNTQYQSGIKRQITRTYYDVPYSSTINGLFNNGQKYLRNRVATIMYVEYDGEDYDFATHYCYDVHGNVKTVIQDIPELADMSNPYTSTGHRYKYLYYYYDLVSGNVNEVRYQPDESDQFYHKYAYDADNRITTVLTSRDGIIWDQDASYEYYLHGPLARTVLGDQNVQGIDFAYTIHGWLKGVNSETLDVNRDIGQDGKVGTENQNVARDAFGFSLGYYTGDYKSIGSANFLANRSTTNLGGTNENLDLYNGNIGHMVSANRAMINEGKGILGMNYKYDQLNRIKSSESFVKTDVGSNSWSTVNAANIYSTQYDYDANGNITHLERYGFRESDTLMDDLDYFYFPNSNRLKAVADKAGTDDYFTTALGGVEDINSGQDTTVGGGNYFYDEIGNLIQDKQESIKNIEWSVYGKVLAVEREDTSQAPNLEFRYDAMGNRIMKLVKPTPAPGTWKYTYYLRDAQGNVMAVYDKKNALADSNYNDSLITKFIRDSIGIDTLAPFMQFAFEGRTDFTDALIDELAASGDDTVVINKYTFNQILGWDNSIADDLLEAYAGSATNYDAIINELIDHERNNLVDAFFAGDEGPFLGEVLDNDGNNDFLDCYTSMEIDDLWNMLVMPPTPSFSKADRIADLMTLVDRNTLISELINFFGLYNTTKDHLKNCVSNTLLEDALHDATFDTKAYILSKISSQMSNSSLASFFTTGKDPSSWRPFTLLKSAITHAYLLNVIAANSPEDFIENSIVEYYYMVDAILPELNGFTASHYITYVKQYFGTLDANRINNALGLDFVYQQCFAAKEYNLYGSSRLGTKKDTSLLLNTRFKASSIDSTGSFVKDVVYYNYVKEYDTIQTCRILAFKQFELSNHLGNVLATILDRRTLFDTAITSTDTFAIWDADIVSAQDYYPGGMLLPNRVYSADSTGTGKYRYAFNGQERDDELYGSGNSTTAMFWQYDARLGRRWNVDPKPNPSISNYAAFANNPIWFSDILGDTIAYAGSKKFQRRMKSRVWLMRTFGPKELRTRIKNLDQSTQITTIKAGDKGYHKRETNTITISPDKSFYRQLTPSKKSRYIFVRLFIMPTLANELSHAEDQVMGNRRQGKTYTQWPDHTETIGNEDVESNEVENLARGLFIRDRMEDTHYSVEGSGEWTRKERRQFKRILGIFGRNKEKGQKMVDKYTKDDGNNESVKKQLKIWAQ